MAVLTGYFDDSKTDGRVLTLAGYVGGERHWQMFEDQWAAVLDRFEVPYFHMKEFGQPKEKSVYEKWLPPEEHNRERAHFMAGLVRAIGRSQLKGFSSIVRISDLERFNQENGLSLEAYPLAVYANMVTIGRANPKAVVSLIFDRAEQIGSKLIKAQTYANSDTYYRGVTDRIQLTALSKSLTWRNVRPLQAADLIAWEVRKHHLNQYDWWNDRPDDLSAAIDSLEQWSIQNGVTPRKSLEALLEESEIPGILWDYKVLCEAHKARGGVWN
ncbi:MULTISPECIES: DUF3800 domain-containing protein [unclassified Bradyrhizobium]|uniref:DUF3800 domain-containing protein n=1 Tax=unclassified Bradyrhizobium TaxID=2631580 RepID=UPI0028EDB8AE|nr:MULTISPECIES: hypothetical protein [unclassified Bradyrhizobium]